MKYFIKRLIFMVIIMLIFLAGTFAVSASCLAGTPQLYYDNSVGYALATTTPANGCYHGTRTVSAQLKAKYSPYADPYTTYSINKPKATTHNQTAYSYETINSNSYYYTSASNVWTAYCTNCTYNNGGTIYR